MMHSKIGLAAAVVFAAGITLGCETLPRPSGVSLAEATLTDVRDVTGQPGSPSLCTLGGDVCLDGAYRLTFTIDRTLSGPAVHGPISVTQTRARPIVGVKYFIAIEHSKNGREVVWDNPTSQGLCMDELAKAYGLAAQAAQYPCHE